jgi:FKBP-type peptidyl-prolyl cis-trans isomerase
MRTEQQEKDRRNFEALENLQREYQESKLQGMAKEEVLIAMEDLAIEEDDVPDIEDIPSDEENFQVEESLEETPAAKQQESVQVEAKQETKGQFIMVKPVDVQ